MKLWSAIGLGTVAFGVGILAGRYWMRNQTIAATGNTVTLPPVLGPAPTPASYTTATTLTG